MIEKRFIQILFLFLCIMTGTANAQQAEAQKKEINMIKKNQLYLYTEATLPKKNEALATAMERLRDEVQKWIQEKKKNKEVVQDFVLTNIDQIAGKIELPRGNMNRAFVYIKKSDLIPSRNTQVIELDNSLQADTPATSEEMPDSSYEVLSISVPAEETEPAEQASDAIKRLLALKKFDEIQPCLLALKKEGKVTDYKKYAALTKPEDYLLIVYNKQAEIEAVLSDGKERFNLRTNAPDGVANYKGRGAIGVKLSN